MRAIIVPIDNRPVTYVFPKLIAAIAGIEAIAPPRELMGSLTVTTSVEVLNNWLNHQIQSGGADALLVCIDSIIYGGLIPSRRIEASAYEILTRSKVIERWESITAGSLQLYAQSSIMRISDNYDNTEEKSYWSKYGREIFTWSESLHKLHAARSFSADAPTKTRATELLQLESRIDESVRKDYLNTRWRNFQLNRKLLDFAESGIIDFLIFSQDDTGQYGLNVMEKQMLDSEAGARRLTNVVSYSGADEVLMTMIGRWLVDQNTKRPTAAIMFSPISGSEIKSRYEGQTIGESVTAQLSAIGITSRQKDNATPEDFRIVIHTSGDRQGDHIWLSGDADPRNLDTKNAVRETLALLDASNTPCILCDVAYSNGADPELIEQLLGRPDLLGKLWGYAGWNTTGNSLGCAFSMAVARWHAGQTGNSATSEQHLKEALFIRLADDWAYQTQVRAQMQDDLGSDRLTQLMSPYLTRIAKSLGLVSPRAHLTLPWNRSFEIEVSLDTSPRSEQLGATS